MFYSYIIRPDGSVAELQGSALFCWLISYSSTLNGRSEITTPNNVEAKILSAISNSLDTIGYSDYQVSMNDRRWILNGYSEGPGNHSVIIPGVGLVSSHDQLFTWLEPRDINNKGLVVGGDRYAGGLLTGLRRSQTGFLGQNTNGLTAFIWDASKGSSGDMADLKFSYSE